MSGAKKKLERRTAKAQMGLSEREKQELQKQQAQKRNNILAIVGGIVAVVLVVALLVWNSGIIARHTTAVKFAGDGDDLTLTRADMDYFYHHAVNRAYSQEQNLASLYQQIGMEYTPSFDPSSSLKSQYVDAEKTTSFYDYFMQQALTDAEQIVSLYNAAKTDGYTLSEDGQADLDSAKSSMDASIAQYGYANRASFLRANYGRTVNEKVYFKNLERNALALDYHNSTVDAMETGYTDAELEAYYEEHADELDSYDYDYAYFDGAPEKQLDDDGNTIEPTEEESAAAMAKAQESAAAMLAALQEGSTVTVTTDDGETTEPETQDFATLAEAFGSTAYPQTGSVGSDFSAAPFAQWLMDASRTDGDAELFEAESSGYYVVQFHSRQLNDAPSIADVRHILISTSPVDDPATDDIDEGEIPLTDEEISAAYDKAVRIMNEFVTTGEQTAERFGELAEEYSDDTRDADGNLLTPGGLYEDVTPTSNYVAEFLDWIFTPGRKTGDIGLVQTQYGFHIMYLDSTDELQWIASARSALLDEGEEAFLNEVMDRYQLTVNKWYKAAPQESDEAQED